MRWLVFPLTVMALALGCSAEDAGRNESGALPTGVTDGASGSSGIDPTDGSDSESGPDSGNSGGGPKLDVADDSAGNGSGDDPTKQGCEKVDFLFVIDNSGSMGDNQDSLIASFPGFIESIRNTLTDAQDYHIMVVDTDAEWGGQCAALCGLFPTCPDIPAYPCGGGPPTECETILGAGVNFTMGDDAPNMLCPFTSGHRFMDSTEPDLTAAFQCAAKVGSDGNNDERPMSAMVSAVSDDLAMAGNCNEGFVRDDAILVVTIITDEEDDDSAGTADGWYSNLVASKAGDDTAIVMLGLLNDTDAAAPVCPAEAQDPAKIRSVVDRFPNSIRGSVCEPSYNDFFQQAVDLIDTACDEFVPPEG